MTITKTIQMLGIVLVCVGLIAGCASTGVAMSANQAITAAKEANLKATEEGFAWRDTDKIIESAEKALAEGDTDKALKLAKQALKQAQVALQQAREQARVFN